MIQTLTTSAKGQWQEGRNVAFGRSPGRADGVIRVEPARRRQEILGFGAALTDASCWLLSRLPAAKRTTLMAELFSQQQLALSVCRICVGASDYARTCYTFDDTVDDRQLRDFSIDHDRKYILPTLRQARAINPALFLFSSPWSPPGWMKAPATVCGGWMREKYLEVFARYYLRFLKDYAAAGVAVDALTPQNETETDQVSKMPACFWHPELEAAFVRDFMGPMLRRESMTTRIWIMDHNYDLWKRAVWMLDDPKVKQYTDGVAFHGYGGTPDMMSQTHAAHPQVHLYWTEGGPALGPTYATEWCRWSKQITDVLRNWCRSYTAWNLALDEKGTPNIGPFKCAGLVTVDSKSRRITYSGQYWALGHFSRFIQRGAVRVDSSGGAENVHHVAVVNPDGERVLVLTNTGKARTLRIKEATREATIRLATDSIVTLRWKP